MADLLRNADLRRVFVAGAVVFAALDLFQLYMPLYGHSVGLSASGIGTVLGGFAVATFVVRAMITWLVRRYGEERTLAWSMVVAAAAAVLIPFFTNIWVLIAIAFAFGLGLGLGQPLSVMLTYNYSPAGRAGEALGLRIAVNNVIHVAVPVVFGAVGALVGLAPVFWGKSALLVLGALATRRKAA
jgi:MFS family permease